MPIISFLYAFHKQLPPPPLSCWFSATQGLFIKDHHNPVFGFAFPSISNKIIILSFISFFFLFPLSSTAYRCLVVRLTPEGDFWQTTVTHIERAPFNEKPHLSQTSSTYSNQSSLFFFLLTLPLSIAR